MSTLKKRLVSLILCLVMVVSQVPLSAIAAEASTTETGAIVDAAVIFSDLHTMKNGDSSDGSNGYKKDFVTNIMTALKNTGLKFSSVTSAGDAFSVNTDNTPNDGPFGYTDKITGYIHDSLGNVDVNYVWSDHDRYAYDNSTSKTALDKTSRLVYGAGTDGIYGNADDGHYYVYALSMGDLSSYDRYKAGFSYSESNNSSRVAAGFTATVPQAIENFKKEVAQLDKTKPLLIASHQPLFNNRKDNAWAEEWFNAIYEVAKDMDVVFFYGHNHNHETGDDYYYEVGDKMNVATRTLSTGSSWNYNYSSTSTLKSAEKELNFTHVCGGYLEPSTTQQQSNETRQKTALAVTIYEDQIGLTTYTTSGKYTGNYSLDVKVDRAHNDEVQTATLESIAITTQPDKLTYKVGEELDTTGMVVTAAYSDGKTAAVTNYEVAADLSSVGTKTVSVSYTEGDVTKIVTFEIEVKEEEGSEPSVPSDPDEPITPELPDTVYVLVDTPVAGENYLIANENLNNGNDLSIDWAETGVEGMAVVRDGVSITYTEISPVAGTITDSEGNTYSDGYIILDNEDAVWTAAASGDGWTFSNDGYNLTTSGTDSVAAANAAVRNGTVWTYDAAEDDGRLHSGDKYLYFTYYENDMTKWRWRTGDATGTSSTRDIFFYQEIELNAEEDPGETPDIPTDPSEPSEPSEPAEKVTVADKNNTGISITAPGLTGVAAVLNTDSEIVQNAVENLLTNFVSYDITVEGYTEGDVAEVTMPVAQGIENPVVYYVALDGKTAVDMRAVDNGNGTVTFTTTHFSTYVVGDGVIEIELETKDQLVEGSPTTVTKSNDRNIDSGSYYLLYNTDSKRYLTNTSGNKNMLEMTSNESHYWYITKTTNGYYYIQYGGPNGQYLTIGNGTAGLTSDKTEVTIAEVEIGRFTKTHYWDIALGKQYLNNYQGAGQYASGYTSGASDDEGSRWHLYPVALDPDHTFSVEAPHHTNAPALSGETVILTSKLYDTTEGGEPVEVTYGWNVKYEVVTNKENTTPAVVQSIDNDVVTLSGTEGVAVVKATYTKNNDATKTAYAEFVIDAKAPNFTVEIEDPETDVVKTDATLDLNAITKLNGAETTKGTIKWSSSDNTIAEVSQDGLVTPKGTGEVTITVTYTDPKNVTHTDTITLKIEEPVYAVTILDPESIQIKVDKTLDLNAIATKDDEAIENANIVWSIPKEQQSIATIDEKNGIVTAIAEGNVQVTATWINDDIEYTDTIDITVVDAVWSLELHQPIHTVAKEFKAGTTYYTKDATTGVYTEHKNLTKFEDGVTYYTRSVTPINGTIVIKNVSANQTFVDLWAIIYRDGEDIGQLDPETQLPKLDFESSNTQIAEVDDKTGVLTFTGNKGSVTITATYEYATGKFVDDSVTFSLSPSATYQPEDGTDDFPEYPNKGAIRFDKTSTAVGNFSQTGITQMELSMTGVPYSKGVDVIVMLDLSSSMTRCIAHDKKNCTVTNCKTRLKELQDAMSTLQTQLKNSENADNIRIAIADFNGFYTSSSSPYYRDTSDRTVDQAGLTYTAKDKVHTAEDGESLGVDAFIPVEDLKVEEFTYTPSSGTNYDYAFDAIYQLGHAIKKENGDDQRDLYVIFMSDGAPNQYNYYGSQGGESENSGSDDWNYWLTGAIGKKVGNLDGTNVKLSDVVNTSNHYHYFHEETGNQHRMANAVKGNPSTRYEVIRKATTGLSDVLESTGETNMYTLPGLGATMYSVAFDIANDGKIKKDSVEHVLKNIPTGGPDNLDYYLEASTEGALTTAFSKIAGQIVEAAKDVKVTDKMGESFTMVFDAPNTTVKEALAGTDFEAQDFYIEVKDYALNPVKDGDEIIDYVRGTATSKIKLYLGTNGQVGSQTYYAATASGSTNDTNKFATPAFNTTPVGTKLYWTKDAGDSGISVIGADGETYNFLSTGKGTHNMASGAYAYGTITREEIKDSDNPVQNADKKYNSTSTDLIIATPYFVYNAATKVMVWTTEKLTTSELAITYFLYLDKSGGYSGMDGETQSGSYKTNEYAVMLYSNYKGHECEVEFPRPQITWNGAQVTYVFYLVNKDGKPVNRAGTVVPFSEAVYVTDPATYTVVWNDLEQVSSLEASYLAQDHVPDVFSLYDLGATYDIHVFEDEDAQNLNNHFVIGGTSGKVNTTYVFNAKSDGTKYSVPGVYAKGSDYLCKEYNGVSGVIRQEHTDEQGNVYYTYSGGSYTGNDQYMKAIKNDKGDVVDRVPVYGIDDKGMYTIVTKSGASEVLSQFDFHNTTVAFAVVWTPELRPDTVVVDFGLDVEIDVTRNDAMAPGLRGVRATAPAGITMNSGTYTGNNFQNEIDLVIGTGEENKIAIGTATVLGLNSLRFSLDKENGMQFKEPVVFYYESEVNYRKNDVLVSENMYSSVTVIPATTVYYEDEYVTLKTYDNKHYEEVTYTDDTTQTYYQLSDEKYTRVKPENLVSGQSYYVLTYDEKNGWPIDSVASNATQDTDRPGESKISETLDADNVYGYDSAYETMSTHSMNNAAMIHVDANTYGTATFDFYGTGFDVIALTSNETGIINVKVTNANGEVKVNKTVDTYYGYTKKDGEWVVSANTPNAIYQVPVLKTENLPYGRYTAEIRVSYYSAMDHTTAEGYDMYLDAIRIYDPTGVVSGETSNVIVENAYKADGEGWPVYEELRNNIIAASNYQVTENEDGTVTVSGTNLQGAIFIDSNDETTEIAEYVSYGPNNELYLDNNQAIAFNVGVDDTVADVQLGIKVANGDSVTYEINGESYTAKSTTDMYYSILKYAKAGTVIIKNVSGGILSLTNIKVTHKVAPAAPSTTSLLWMDGESAGIALMSLRRMPVIEEPTEPEINPEEPEIKPEEPEVEPEEPEVEPEEPEVEPEEPETKPGKPETKPGKPETKPGKPGKPETKPEKPETKPGKPENKPGKPETKPEEPEVFEPMKLDVSLSATSVKVGKTVTVTVITSSDVEYLTVNGESINRCIYDSRKDAKTWTIKVSGETLGKKDIVVVAYDSDACAADPVINTLTVANNNGKNNDKANGKSNAKPNGKSNAKPNGKNK